MSVFVYPPHDKKLWPTLGPQICAWIEEYLCYGPGDLLGTPIHLDEETKAWIYKFYELYPKGHKKQGQRRFQRCALSLPKGSSKTEIAALITAAELHPEAPVRFGGFSKNGQLLDGRGVTDPYIPMIAYTEEQTEELAYGALRRILEESDIGRDYDIGLERIMRLDGNGKAEAVSTTPNARDGARTTFQHADETHRFTLPRQRQAWQVMLANLAKRPLADPWALETTTAPEPGVGSVAETTMNHAQELAKHKRDSRLFFFHRQASDKHDFMTRKGRKAGVIEARGPYKSKWIDIDRIVGLFEQPDADLAYLERVWGNRPIQASMKAFNVERWNELGIQKLVDSGAVITLGFGGGRSEDATALIATELESGYQWPIGIWERPLQLEFWETPVDEVDGLVRDTFERYEVVRMYCNPPKWESWIARWAGDFGEKVVLQWFTSRRRPFAFALRAFATAIEAGEISHSGDSLVANHIANSCRLYTNLTDDDDRQLWVIRKERPDSHAKIKAAVASVLSWEARNDAIKAGALDIREAGDVGITVGTYG